MRRFTIALLLAGAACGGSPTGPPWDFTVHVTGTVRDFRTDAPVSGARVAFGATTATTDAAGRYTLTVETGEYTITIDDVAEDIVTLNSRTYRGDLYVRTTGCIARYGTIVDALTRFPIAAAQVSLQGRSATTDQTGWFKLMLSCSGEICSGFNTTFATITHPDYKDASFVVGRGVCGVARVDYALTRR
jgi:hypothetical protein